MRRANSWGLALAALVGCSTGPGIGDQCVFGEQGIAGAESFKACAEGYCSSRTTLCERPTPTGQHCEQGGCDTYSCWWQCADGGFCSGIDSTCHLPGPDGAQCVIDANCATGLVCIHGETDRFVGICHARSDVGGPCQWLNGKIKGNGTSTGPDPGCAPGLVCVPDARIDLSLPIPTSVGCENPPSWYSLQVDPECWFHGTCQMPNTTLVGGPCLSNEGCATNRCYPVKPPVGIMGAQGIVCPLNANCMPDAPWAGFCFGATDLIEGAACSITAGATPACGPGMVCDPHYGRATACSSMHQYYDNRCSAVDLASNVIGSDDICPLGERCSLAATTCGAVGTGVAGATCASDTDCYSSMWCSSDIGAAMPVCTPLKHVGDACGANDQCATGLTCMTTCVAPP